MRPTTHAKNRVLAIGAIALTAFSLTACTAEATNTESSGKKDDIKIGFVVKTNSNPFWVYT